MNTETAGARALNQALRGVLGVLSGRQQPAGPARPPRASPRDRLDDVIGDIVGGRLAGLFAIRLMVSVGVAAVISEALSVQRSYWVVLTVALVLRPDFGSVFARAVAAGRHQAVYGSWPPPWQSSPGRCARASGRRSCRCRTRNPSVRPPTRFARCSAAWRARRPAGADRET